MKKIWEKYLEKLETYLSEKNLESIKNTWKYGRHYVKILVIREIWNNEKRYEVVMFRVNAKKFT